MASHTEDQEARQIEESDGGYFDRLLDVTLPFSAALIVLQVIVMMTDILYALVSTEAGIYVSNRVVQTMLIWITFLSVALHQRDDDHIRVKYVLKKLPERVQSVLSVSETVLNFLFAVWITLGAFEIASYIYTQTTAEGIPTILIYLPVILCGLFLIGVFGRELIGLSPIDGVLNRGGGSDG